MGKIMAKKDILDDMGAVTKQKTTFGKVMKWLVGGGIVVIVSGAITFGMTKERLANELLQNKQEHAVIQDTLEKQNVRLERMPVIENDIKWIKTELMRTRIVNNPVNPVPPSK